LGLTEFEAEYMYNFENFPKRNFQKAGPLFSLYWEPPVNNEGTMSDDQWTGDLLYKFIAYRPIKMIN
jgi:hypothetical protein